MMSVLFNTEATIQFLNYLKLLGVTVVCLFLVTFNYSALAADDICSVTAANANPFADAAVPLPSSYQGPKFQLSYNYPTTLPQLPPDLPWLNA